MSQPRSQGADRYWVPVSQCLYSLHFLPSGSNRWRPAAGAHRAQQAASTRPLCPWTSSISPPARVPSPAGRFVTKQDGLVRTFSVNGSRASLCRQPSVLNMPGRRDVKNGGGWSETARFRPMGPRQRGRRPGPDTRQAPCPPLRIESIHRPVFRKVQQVSIVPLHSDQRGLRRSRIAPVMLVTALDTPSACWYVAYGRCRERFGGSVYSCGVLPC